MQLGSIQEAQQIAKNIPHATMYDRGYARCPSCALFIKLDSKYVGVTEGGRRYHKGCPTGLRFTLRYKARYSKSRKKRAEKFRI